MSKFNQEWLERYRRNPRQNNILYKNYANPGVGNGGYTPDTLGPNPLAQAMFKHGEQQGAAAGRQEGINYLSSFAPENMKDMPLGEMLNALNTSYEGNQWLMPKIQHMQQQAQQREAQQQQLLEDRFEQLAPTLYAYSTTVGRENLRGDQNPYFVTLVNRTGSIQDANNLLAYYAKKYPAYPM